jgi:hypothetical protein
VIKLLRHFLCRVPALNTDAQFIDDMSALVEEALYAPSLSVYEATPINSNDLSESFVVGPSDPPSFSDFGITEAGNE